MSTDTTKDIVTSYADKLDIHFISEPDKGIYDAMNKGIQRATGDIIGILNSDDFFYNENVLKIVANSFLNKEAEAIYGDIVYFSENTDKVTRYWKTGEYKESKLNNGWTIPHPALFIRKSVYEKYGLFRTDYKIAADYEFILRALKVHKIKTSYVPKIFVKMYNGGTSAQNTTQRKAGWQELKKAWVDNNLKTPRFFITRRVLLKILQFLIK
jgi:glycosyltransferase involved in cell wall biosynthesis